MTNDKDGAALLREAEKAAKAWRVRCSTDPGDMSMCKPKDDCVFGYTQGYFAALQLFVNVLDIKIKPSFDAAGVREDCAKVARNFEYKEPTHYFDDPFSAAGEMIAEEILALPIPGAPASVEPVAGIIIPKLDPVHAERHPVLAPIIEKRALAAANFSPEFSGQRGQDFDRGLLCAFEAVNGQLQRMTQESTLPEPDTIGSNFGNGGGLDPVEAKYLICKGGAYYRPNAQGYTRNRAEAGRYTLEEAISHSHPNGPDGPRDGITYELDTATPSPGFGGGDLREALSGIREWIAGITVTDMNELVADGGVTAGMLVGQEASEQLRRLDIALAALPPVKQSVGKFQRGDHVEKISGSNWRGKVVGEYSTDLTPEGYAVESDTETGSVQIYPAKALRLSHDQRGGAGE